MLGPLPSGHLKLREALNTGNCRYEKDPEVLLATGEIVKGVG